MRTEVNINMSEHNNVLAMAVVALVAVAGLVLYYGNQSLGAATYGSIGSGPETNDYFALGLQAGKECLEAGVPSTQRDEWRMCCEDKCNTENKCQGKTFKWGVTVVNECSRNCNSGCNEQIRREVLIMSQMNQ